MPSKIQLDENLWFLYICLQKSDYKAIDFNLVGDATGLKPPAARMRYTRLRRAIEGGTLIGTHGTPFLGGADKIAEAQKKRKRPSNTGSVKPEGAEVYGVMTTRSGNKIEKAVKKEADFHSNDSLGSDSDSDNSLDEAPMAKRNARNVLKREDEGSEPSGTASELPSLQTQLAEQKPQPAPRPPTSSFHPVNAGFAVALSGRSSSTVELKPVTPRGPVGPIEKEIRASLLLAKQESGTGSTKHHSPATISDVHRGISPSTLVTEPFPGVDPAASGMAELLQSENKTSQQLPANSESSDFPPTAYLVHEGEADLEQDVKTKLTPGAPIVTAVPAKSLVDFKSAPSTHPTRSEELFAKAEVLLDAIIPAPPSSPASFTTTKSDPDENCQAKYIPPLHLETLSSLYPVASIEISPQLSGNHHRHSSTDSFNSFLTSPTTPPEALTPRARSAAPSVESPTISYKKEDESTVKIE
ncbi:MAG: hypothetical protein M1829_003541 [Trizodia sp. TS-e1964]|nr:MAG: hypothetical protein M1829_003541 [Trizodia sp. TS-e1964]